MDVVVVATSFPRHEGDHAGRFVLDLSRGLAERGHHVSHVVPEADGCPERETMGERIDVRRVPFARRPAERGLVYGDGIGANLRARPLLVRAVPRLLRALAAGAEAELARCEAPVLLTHWAYPGGVVGAGLRQRLGVRHVNVAHGGGLQLLTSWPWMGRAFRRWLSGVDAAVFVSGDLLEKARRKAGAAGLPFPVHVQPMGVDVRRFAPRGAGDALRAELGMTPADVVALGAGRLIRLKGFDLLVEAAAGLPLRVCLAGAGPERERIAALARRCGASVTFLGHLGPERLAAAYEASDFVVIPSRLGPRGRSEGSPMVAVEAFAAHRPVLAAASGGLRAVVEDGVNGLLFPVGDTAELRRRLQRLVADEGLRGALALGAVASAPRYDYTRVAAELEKVLAGDGDAD